MEREKEKIYQEVKEWLKNLDFTHSLSVQLPFCVKTYNLSTTKCYIKGFMLDFEKGIIYKKYKQGNKTRKDTNDWERDLLEFVVLFENCKNPYSPYHCHILFDARKRNGSMYTEEEISNALEYAKERFTERLSKKESSTDVSHLLVEYQVREIVPEDNIFGYDIKEYVQNGSITDPDRFEVGSVLLGVTKSRRPHKIKPQNQDPEIKQVAQVIINESPKTDALLQEKPMGAVIYHKKPSRMRRFFIEVWKSVSGFLGFFSHKPKKQPINNDGS